MRCLFTMFAEDVELLPKRSFRDVLAKCVDDPKLFPRLVGQLWEAMDTGGFSFAIEREVRKFNGYLFKNRTVLPLPREEIGELYEAAKADWKQVEPAIFGALLEQALNPAERRKLGAHYTPRAYVERLVVATIMEPLRAEWANVQATAEAKRADGDAKGAAKEVEAFHERLCETKILDPACGTGNFLYVSLELMKRLEGEVLEAMASLSEQGRFAGYELKTIDPHQFLGLEVNPRAAAIAELVLWIGYLQWHFRTRGGVPPEPILRDFKTIKAQDAVLAWDKKELARDDNGKPLAAHEWRRANASKSGAIANPERPEWPAADFIVGNPPFIGGKDIRGRTRRRLRRSSVGRPSADERERRFRHVLVGPRRRSADAQGNAIEALRLGHHEFAEPSVSASASWNATSKRKSRSRCRWRSPTIPGRRRRATPRRCGSR